MKMQIIQEPRSVLASESRSACEKHVSKLSMEAANLISPNLITSLRVCDTYIRICCEHALHNRLSTEVLIFDHSLRCGFDFIESHQVQS